MRPLQKNRKGMKDAIRVELEKKVFQSFLKHCQSVKMRPTTMLRAMVLWLNDNPAEKVILAIVQAYYRIQQLDLFQQSKEGLNEKAASPRKAVRHKKAKAKNTGGKKKKGFKAVVGRSSGLKHKIPAKRVAQNKAGGGNGPDNSGDKTA